MNKGQAVVMLLMYFALIPIFIIFTQSYSFARIGVYLIWADLILGNVLKYILGFRHAE